MCNIMLGGFLCRKYILQSMLSRLLIMCYLNTMLIMYEWIIP